MSAFVVVWIRDFYCQFRGYVILEWFFPTNISCSVKERTMVFSGHQCEPLPFGPLFFFHLAGTSPLTRTFFPVLQRDYSLMSVGTICIRFVEPAKQFEAELSPWVNIIIELSSGITPHLFLLCEPEILPKPLPMTRLKNCFYMPRNFIFVLYRSWRQHLVQCSNGSWIYKGMEPICISRNEQDAHMVNNGTAGYRYSIAMTAP